MNDLQLFLITYNRKEKCRQTLEKILEENSPVKHLPLTVLDNCSTDGTMVSPSLEDMYPFLDREEIEKNRWAIL